jgi:hypothetical protein
MPAQNEHHLLACLDEKFKPCCEENLILVNTVDVQVAGCSLLEDEDLIC